MSWTATFSKTKVPTPTGRIDYVSDDGRSYFEAFEIQGNMDNSAIQTKAFNKIQWLQNQDDIFSALSEGSVDLSVPETEATAAQQAVLNPPVKSGPSPQEQFLIDYRTLVQIKKALDMGLVDTSVYDGLFAKVKGEFSMDYMGLL